MRKVLYWYVPAVVALIASAVFATGFYSYLRGDTGSAVTVTPQRTGLRSVSTAARTINPIILGDSLARGTGDQSGLGIGGRFVDELKKRHIPSNDIVNIAINGARTADLLKQLEHHNIRVLLAQSNVVIVSIGGNDLWGDNMRSAPVRDPEPMMKEVLARLEQVVDTARGANASARIYVIGLYNPFVTTPFGKILTPLVTRWNAQLTERFSSDSNVVIVQTSDIFAWRDRLSEDRFHPNGEGYELIARRIADTF